MAVRAHSDVIRGHAFFEHGLDAVGRRSHRAAAARGDVHVAARQAEGDGALKDVGVTRAVGRADVLNRHALLDAFKEHIEGPDDVSEVNVQHAEFARDHGAHADLRQEPHHFGLRRETRAMVAHGDLDAEHFGDEIQVVAHAACERRGRESVVAGVHPGRDTLGLQGADFTQQVGHRAARTVGARDAHHARGAAFDELGQNQLGRAGLGAAFAAAARDVNVLIDKARGQGQTLGLDRFQTG